MIKAASLAVIPLAEAGRQLWNAYGPQPTTVSLIFLIVSVIGVVAAFFVSNPMALLGFSLLLVFSCYSFWQLYRAETVSMLTDKVEKVQAVIDQFSQEQQNVAGEIVAMRNMTQCLHELQPIWRDFLTEMASAAPQAAPTPRSRVLQQTLEQLRQLRAHVQRRVADLHR